MVTERCLYGYGNQIHCSKAVKGENYISAYFNGAKILEDSVITDFSGYNLTDEDGNSVEFSAPELAQPSEIELFAAEMSSVFEAIQTQNDLAIAEPTTLLAAGMGVNPNV